MSRSGFKLPSRMRRASYIPLALVALSTLPAKGQSFDDAVRANTQLATALCLQVMIDRTIAQTTFGASGFAYRAIDRGTNEHGIALGLDHFFDAPADTVKAEVDFPDRNAGICMVYTTHLAEPAFADIVAATIFQRFPGAQVRGPTEWFISTPSGLPLIVSTSTINRHRYEAPGTVMVSMGYPG
ncbi:hypothetical protein ROLI_007830 [Roseobacter fucihabitans]|uniref:Uncharacterized protein n=1 Tax=Roseobacter fucihabitans TaxID=1537242 RepID=A0ABZ2BR61_9RHOB|nr:hypothetical protein [Roseobacter litoralis]MBC6966049.1 hypothetical protein [Roseobacter litoralis]